MKDFLLKIHHKIVDKMVDSTFVENVLIAKVEDEDGKLIDCIYCTIIRNALIFMGIGLIFGFLIGKFATKSI